MCTSQDNSGEISPEHRREDVPAAAPRTVVFVPLRRRPGGSPRVSDSRPAAGGGKGAGCGCGCHGVPDGCAC